MAYTIDTYSNSRSWKIEDGTIDQTTDLKLVGKNYAGYGEIQNENFVFLLENFAGQTEPPRKIAGQMWFDSGNGKLKFYDGTKWRTTGGAEVSDTSPNGLKEGDFWWDTANEQLYTYNGGDFVLIGPQSAGAGQTQVVSRSVRDTTGTPRNIITAVVNDEVVLTFSSQDFELDSNDADSNIIGFDRIRQGLTLKNTIIANGGVTSGDWRLWGTASNADKLGGLSQDSYVQANNASFTGLATFAGAGIQIGPNGNLKLSADGTKGLIENATGNVIEFRAKDVFGVLQTPLSIQYDALIPGLDNGQPNINVSIGTETYRWPTIYAKTVDGTATFSQALVAQGTTGETATDNQKFSPSIQKSEYTVPIRDGNGDIFANYFQGIATTAWYADLAEKYTTGDTDLEPGTAVAVGTDDCCEVVPAKSSDICIGVVSTQPALMMNSSAPGQYIGLKGRLPVKVKGPVTKGQGVYAWEEGYCTTVQTNAFVGVALESNDSEEIKLIECVLKV